MNQIVNLLSPLRWALYTLLAGMAFLFLFFGTLLYQHLKILNNGWLLGGGSLSIGFFMLATICLASFKRDALLSLCNEKLARARFTTSLVAPGNLKQLTSPEAVLNLLVNTMTMEYHETVGMRVDSKKFNEASYMREFAYNPLLMNLHRETKSQLVGIVLERIEGLKQEIVQTLGNTPVDKYDPARIKYLDETLSTLAYYDWVLKSIDYPNFETDAPATFAC